MSQNPTPNSLADEFEDEWFIGLRPLISNYLPRVTPEQHSDLLELLVPIDIEYRKQQNESVQVSDYLQFGEIAQQIAFSILNPKTEALDRSAESQVHSSDLIHSTIGPFRLVRQLGEGGMGTVYLAEQTQPIRRQVAVKLIKQGTDSKECIARFESERQALALMDHPAIAKIIDAGTTDAGQPYFAMEYVPGKRITDYCDQENLSVQKRLEIFVQICQAVQHAHQKGIIHRDLKPSNILVTEVNGLPVPKVIDFGLAKAFEPTLNLTDITMATEFGQVLGTLKYMSPEQALLDPNNVDTRTDIYALGVILYELLTGSTPINEELLRGKAILKILELVREQETPRPSHRLSNTNQGTLSQVTQKRKTDPKSLGNALVGDLDWIVMKALEKDRNRRFDSAGSFGDDVVRFLQQKPVLARPPSWSYQLQKTISRHRVATTLILVSLVGTLFSLLGLTYGFVQANRLANLKQQELKLSEAQRGFESQYLVMKSSNEPFGRGQVDDLRPLISSIEKLEPSLGRTVNIDVHQTLGINIRSRLQSAALSRPELDDAKQDFAYLRSFNESLDEKVLDLLVGELGQRLADRETQWLRHLELGMPDIEPDRLANSILTDDETLQNLFLQNHVSEDQFTLIGKNHWRLGQPMADVSGARLSIQFEPNDDWDATELVLSISDAGTDDGYQFSLKTQQPESSIREAIQSETPLLFSVFRAKQQLWQEELACSPSLTWEIRIEIDRGNVTFQVNKAQISFRDAFGFAIAGATANLYSDADLNVKQLTVDFRPTPRTTVAWMNADRQFVQQNYGNALSEYMTIDNAEANYKAAMALFELGRIDESVAEFKAIFDSESALSPDSPWHLLSGFWLAKLYSDQSNPNAGRVVIARMLTEYPTQIAAYLNYLPQKVKQQNLKRLRRRGVRWGVVVQPAGDLEQLRFASKLDKEDNKIPPEIRRATQWRLADALRVDNQFEEAIQILQTLIREVNDSKQSSVVETVTLTCDLAWLLIQLGRFEEARELIQTQLELLADRNPAETTPLLAYRVRLDWLEGNRDDAKEGVENIFSIFENAPENVLSHGVFSDICLVSGWVFSELGESDTAKAYWKRGLRRNWDQWPRDRLDQGGPGYREINYCFSMSNEMILHSLTGASRNDDLLEGLWTELNGERTATTNNVYTLAKLFRGVPLRIKGVVRKTFDAPKVGTSWREQMILRQCNFKDYFYRPIPLLLYQGMKDLLLAGMPTDEAFDLDAFQAVQDIVQLYDEEKIDFQDFSVIVSFLLFDWNEKKWAAIKRGYPSNVAAGIGVIKSYGLSRMEGTRDQVRQVQNEFEEMENVPSSFKEKMRSLVD